MQHQRSMATRLLALTLGMLCLFLTPLSALAADRDLNYLGITGSKNGYTTKPTVTIPSGGFPENQWISGTNPLTGEDWSGEYRPILVNIDTDPGARPNFGVSSADIIYELPLHRTGHTRSVALFMGDVPEGGAGPVRSARIPMIDIQQEWQAGYLFWGVQEAKGTSVRDYVREINKNLWDRNTYAYPLADGIAQRNAPYFNPKIKGYANPHDRLGLPAVLVNAGHVPVVSMRPWRFSDDGLDHGASAYHISMEFRPDFIPSFEYNEATRSYDRYYNSEPFIDANNGEHCTFANVIIMRTDVSWYRNNPQRPVIKMTGQGQAEIFMDGRYIRGTWVRAMSKSASAKDIQARTVFLDDRGQEISFLPGKTFIHVVSEEQQVVIGNDPTEGDPLKGGKAMPTPKPTKTPKPTRTPRPTRTPKPDANVEPITPEDDGGEVELPDE